jgi:hypothetical protein
MNDDIYPVTPRITDPDLRPRDHYTGSNVGSSRVYGDSHGDNLIEFEDDDLGAKRPKQGAKSGADSQSNSSSGFNVFGFNLTYKHIIIIVLVIIALLIVIYLVVNWLRKPGPSEPLQPPTQQPQRQPQQPRPAAPGRQNADAARSAAELAALMQQTQSKLDELNDNDDANDTAQPERPVVAATPPVIEAPPTVVSTQTEAITAPSINTHMDVPQEQIDNILSTEEDA